jgi:hypothetical protein
MAAPPHRERERLWARGALVGLLVLLCARIPGTAVPVPPPEPEVPADAVTPGGPGSGVAEGAPGTQDAIDTDPGAAEPERTSVLAGQVLGPDGAPAHQAAVTVAGSGIWPPRVVATDPAGRFRMEGLPAGIYELSARKGSLRSDPRQGLALTAGAPVFVSLRLHPGVPLEGLVVDARSGAPIAGAEVTVTEDLLSFDPLTLRTGPDGRFRATGLARGPHWVTVSAEGYVARVAEKVRPGSADVRIALRPAGAVAGVVLDALHRPVAGAQIELVGRDESGLPLVMTGPAFGLRRQLADAESTPGTTDGLPVIAGPVPPIPTAALLPPSEAETGPAFDPGPIVSAGFFTDARGRFEITGVPPGQVQVVARHPHHAPASTRPLRVAVGSRVDELTLVLPEGGSVEGRLLDAGGFPVPRIPVQLRMEGEPTPRLALTAKDGAFEFHGVAGSVVLAALPEGQPVGRLRSEVAPGQRLRMDLSLPDRSHVLRARALDEGGFPVGGVRVSVRAIRSDASVERMGITGSDGTLEVSGLPGPPYRLVARHHEHAETVLARVDEGTKEVSITMRAGARITGQVRDGFDDVPLEGAQVRLRASGGAEAAQEARTNTSGHFEFRMLPAGKYELLIEHLAFASAAKTAVLRKGPRGLEDLDLGMVELAPGGRIAGHVVDRHGDPVPEAEVAVGTPPDWARAVRADMEGGFVLDGVPPGPTRVEARHPAAGRAAAPGMVVVRVKSSRDDVRIRLPQAYDPGRADLGEGYRTGVAVEIHMRGGQLRVRQVREGSAAERAGLRPGDVLVAVDDEDVESADQAALLLAGPSGVEAVIDVLRNGREERLLVPRERYLP